MTPDEVSAASDVAVAFVASIALFLAWRQVKASHETGALTAYENYHTLALAHPALASGRFNFEAADPDEVDRYAFFVSYTLMTGERITAIYPKDESWAESIRDDIRMHRRFISSPLFRPFLENQPPRMRLLIDQVLREADPSSPPAA
jgi:hypothetical protein